MQPQEECITLPKAISLLMDFNCNHYRNRSNHYRDRSNHYRNRSNHYRNHNQWRMILTLPWFCK